MARQNALSEASPDTESGQADKLLPVEWKSMRLEDVFRFTKKPKELRYADFNVLPFVPMDFIPNGSVFFDEFILRDVKELTSGTYFEPRDVLVAKITPSFENGKQGIIKRLPTPFGLATTEVIPIQDIENVSDRYFLFFYLLHPEVRSALAGKMEGSTGRQRLSVSTLANLEVSLPPLPEQRAIAHVLQAVQDAIQARHRELELEREHKASLMQHLFIFGTSNSYALIKETRFGSVPKHWKILPLEQCATVQTGVTKGRRLGEEKTIKLPYLRVANVQDGYLDLSEIKEIELKVSEVESYSLQVGDIVVTEGGDFDKLGRGFLWKGQISPCVHQNHIFAVRANPKLLVPEYLAYLIQSDYAKAYFLSVAHKTTNLASINSTKLKAFPTLIPSQEEQRDIMKLLSACDTIITSLERETTLLQELFETLLDELMTGRVSTIPLIATLDEETTKE